jgi:hypothetical protein
LRTKAESCLLNVVVNEYRTMGNVNKFSTCKINIIRGNMVVNSGKMWSRYVSSHERRFRQERLKKDEERKRIFSVRILIPRSSLESNTSRIHIRSVAT